MRLIWVGVLLVFLNSPSSAQSGGADVPSYRGTIGVTYPNGTEFTEFLTTHSGELVFLDMSLLMDVATAYNFQLAQLCSSEDDRTLAELTPYEIPDDIGNLLEGNISGHPIPMPTVFSEDGDWRSILSEQKFFPEVAVDCFSNRLLITAPNDEIFHFSSGGTGIAFYNFKGYFDTFAGTVGATTIFDLVYVPETEARARIAAGTD